VVQLKKPPHVGAASNALALMGATSYPMHRTDLRDAVVERCNLAGAALDGADLRGATFRSCTLRGTSLAWAQIEGLVLVGDCGFGMPRPPITHQLPYSRHMRMAVSRDATRAVVASEKSVHVIDLALCIVARMVQVNNDVSSVCMTRDERFCVLGHWGGASITVWDTATWAQVRTLTGGHPIDPRNGVALVATPDSKTLVSSAADCMIVVWDLATARSIFAPQPQTPSACRRPTRRRASSLAAATARSAASVSPTASTSGRSGGTPTTFSASASRATAPRSSARRSTTPRAASTPRRAPSCCACRTTSASFVSASRPTRSTS
jgi:hypothetical protein